MPTVGELSVQVGRVALVVPPSSLEQHRTVDAVNGVLSRSFVLNDWPRHDLSESPAANGHAESNVRSDKNGQDQE